MSKKYKNQSTNNIIRGFTLIELLAVIVILAIIALIAVPIVLGIINDSKNSSMEESIKMYGNAVTNAVGTYLLNNPGDKNITKEKIKDYIKYDGENVDCKTTIIYSDGNIYLDECSVGDEEVNYTYGIKKNIKESSTIITFTIDGIQFNAEEGMTWYSFISSNYNTDNYVNSSIFSLSEYSVIDSNNNIIYGNMQIINNEQYVINFYGKTQD